MHKIFSVRMEEEMVKRVALLARRLRTSKKQVLESAIEMYASNLDTERELDVFEETCGAWRRNEKAQDLVRESRDAFSKSMRRHAR